MDLTKTLLEHYKIRNTVISGYHPQANGLVERGHAPIVNSLTKYCGGSPQLWPQYLALALWADRISVRRSTGYSAFELLYGRECLLPVELMIESWQTVDWDAVQSREDLILARMQQLDNRRVTETLAAENLRNSRKGNKTYFDQHHRLRPESQQLRVGDLVLLFDSALQKTRNTKLLDNWRGPYRITEVPRDSTFYRLEELDGTPLAQNVAGNRLKKFFTREMLERDDVRDAVTGDQEETRVQEGEASEEDEAVDSAEGEASGEEDDDEGDGDSVA